MSVIQKYAKTLGKNHALAQQLWDTGYYEARMVAIHISERAQVTPEQMDAWCEDFENWAICDTACFALWDHTPHVWPKAKEWANSPDEFRKRAAFALLAGLTIHDKKAPDAKFLAGLKWIEKAAKDDRNFVKKAVNWALRSIGKKNLALHAPALALAETLAASEIPSARWIGKDAARELRSEKVLARLQRKAQN
jgi:3-methyladenine DNA glycosylase AlkD